MDIATRVVARAVAMLLFSTAAFAQTTIPVVTYNVSNNRPAPATIVNEINALSASPPVISLQEVDSADLPAYKTALEQTYPGTTWTWAFQGHNCKFSLPCYAQGGAYNPANDSTSEGNAVLTRWPAAYHKEVFMAKDEWWLGRAAVLAHITVPGYGAVNVASGHSPTDPPSGSPETRDDYAAAIKSWALGFTGPRLIGADFNFNPGATSLYSGLLSGNWVDAWADFNGSPSGGETKSTRIDYWISHMDAQPSTIDAQFAQVGPWGASDHRPFFVNYTIGGGSSPTAWTFTDDFNDGSIDTAAKWTVQNLFSGGSNTSAVTVVETTRLEITLVNNGPSNQYNGVVTKTTRAFQNAEASVELVQPPNAAAVDAYAMLTIGTSSTALYRWWVAGGRLVAEKNVGAGKVRPVDIPYNATNHRFLRIRNDGTNVVWETRAASGSWQLQHSEVWSSAVPLNLLLELKGGTSAGQLNPGVVVFDNFDARRP